VGNVESTLGSIANVVLDISVASEACPLGLAPTASTVAMLAMGDAVAMCAMELRGFTREDYALYHPAGALGRRLTMRVSDVMRTGEHLAIVDETCTLQSAMFQISKAGAGCAFVVDGAGLLLGIITDGDIRRAIQQDRDSLDRSASQVMVRRPFVISGNPLAAEALQLIDDSGKKIGEAPVLDADGRPVGMLMLKDLLRSGLV
ncbi:MAG: CBS domain-containing protein, partial [Chthonomonadales bacterium]